MMDRAISSLEQRLRTLQLNACIPAKEAKSLHRMTWCAFHAWKAHPVCPSWHSKWLLKRGYAHESKLNRRSGVAA